MTMAVAWTEPLTDNSFIVPVACQFPAYVAGPNETALVNLSISFAAGQATAAGAVLFLDGVSFEGANNGNLMGAETPFMILQQDSGHLSVSRAMPLTAGSSFVFSAAGGLTGAGAPTIPTDTGRCNGTLTILRQ